MERSKSKFEFWRIAIIPIIVFGCISGLRFGRDIDYNYYYLLYTYNEESVEFEYLFNLFFTGFRELDFSYSLLVFLSSLILITSLIFFLYQFRLGMQFTLPLFLGIMGIENLMRWYLAVSFLLFGLGFYFRKRGIWSILFMFGSLFVHLGVLPCLIVGWIFKTYFNRKVVSTQLALIFFSISFVFSSTDILVFIARGVEYFPQLGISEKQLVYFENLVDIASGGMRTGVYKIGLFTKLLMYFSYVFPIYFVTTFLRRNDEYSSVFWIFNLGIFSLIILPLFSLVEVFNRFSATFMILSLLIIGYAYHFSRSKFGRARLAGPILVICFIISSFLILRTPVLTNSDLKMLYVWDANGREYLPY